MKVSELTGAMLDYFVALHDDRCEGLRMEWKGDHFVGYMDADGKSVVCIGGAGSGFKASLKLRTLYGIDVGFIFNPSAMWKDGGPIIEREHIHLNWYKVHNGKCEAILHRKIGPGVLMLGETALEAAMRAYVASKIGPTVPPLENVETNTEKQ